jgi:hypothetical protein
VNYPMRKRKTGKQVRERSKEHERLELRLAEFSALLGEAAPWRGATVNFTGVPEASPGFGRERGRLH